MFDKYGHYQSNMIRMLILMQLDQHYLYHFKISFVYYLTVMYLEIIYITRSICKASSSSDITVHVHTEII